MRNDDLNWTPLRVATVVVVFVLCGSVLECETSHTTDTATTQE